MKTRDFQKQAVYDWESRRFSRRRTEEMPAEDCTALVEDICRCYGLPVPTMNYPEGYQAKKSFYRPYSSSITLYKWARQRYIILHEVAHYIHHRLGSDGVDHGKQYFSIFAYLISEYMTIPLYEVFHKAKQDGILLEDSAFPKFKEGMVPAPQFVKRFA